MLALTVWQPWAGLIVHGLKPVEFRGWMPPARLVGQRIVIHAGMEPTAKHVRHLLASDDHIRGSCGFGCDVAAIRAALERAASNPELLPRGCGVGTAILGPPETGENYYRRHDHRRGLRGPWHNAWPMLEPVHWAEPVAARGMQGFWRWPG